MSISPLSGGAVPAGTDPNSEVRAAKMAKDQQKMEGAQALSMIQSAGSAAPPPPTGAAGGNINIMV